MSLPEPGPRAIVLACCSADTPVRHASASCMRPAQGRIGHGPCPVMSLEGVRGRREESNEQGREGKDLQCWGWLVPRHRKRTRLCRGRNWRDAEAGRHTSPGEPLLPRNGVQAASACTWKGPQVTKGQSYPLVQGGRLQLVVKVTLPTPRQNPESPAAWAPGSLT